MRLPRLVGRLGVAMALVLATTVPSWSEEGPAYRLGDAKLDTDLGRADHHLGDTAATGLFAQATGTSGSAESSAAPPDGADESASELNRKLTNPVSTLWSLFERTAGLGDMILLELLSPANTGNWVLGAGPTFIFPTATSKFTGQGKWQAGPSVVVGYLTKRFFLGVFPQQWFSIGGHPDRPDTSQLNLQPIATVFFGDGWNVGYSGNILANWKAPSGDVWTVPIGLGIGKVVRLGRLPVKLELGLQYMPVRPRSRARSGTCKFRSRRSSRSSSREPSSSDRPVARRVGRSGRRDVWNTQQREDDTCEHGLG